GSWTDDLPELRRSNHERRWRVPCMRGGSAAASSLELAAPIQVRSPAGGDDVAGSIADRRRKLLGTDDGVPNWAAGQERPLALASRQTADGLSGVGVLGGNVGRRGGGVAIELGAAVCHRLGQRANFGRLARPDIRTFAKPFAGILWAQADRRFDVADRHR